MQNNNEPAPGNDDQQDSENKNIAAAEKAAEHDIDMDPESSLEPEAGDDLDEGELAQFESGDDDDQ